MRIVVAGPETNDTLIHNIISNFRSMGHAVSGVHYVQDTFFKTTSGRGVELLLEKASRRWRTRLERDTLEMVKRVNPQLVVVGTRTLDPNFVEDIRRIGRAKIVCWYTDPPANVARDHIVGGEYDAVFLKDMAFAQRLRDLLGLDAYHLDEACNPNWHRPVAVRANDAVVVAGSLYGFRARVCERILDAGYNVRIYGTGPSLWTNKRVVAQHTGTYLDHTNKARVFGEAMACLNTFTPAEGDSLNCRVFEACGCGALLLSEARRALERCFESGKEYLSFASFEECIEYLAKLRKDHTWGDLIRRNAAKRAHGEHTYQRRLNSMLQTIGMK